MRKVFLHHVSIRVKDYEKAVMFYRALGLEKYVEWKEDTGRCIFMKTKGEAFLELKEFQDEVLEPGRYQHICFHCNDVDVMYDAAIKNGAKTVVKPCLCPLNCLPRPIENARVCHVIGPNEELIEIIDWHGYEL